nr:PH domain-containing protein [Saccharopolyspora sp. HNM0983]
MDPKTIAASVALVLAPLVPAAAVVLVSGTSPAALGTMAVLWLGIAALIAGGSALEWYFSRFRITAERFELRSGALSRSHRSIPRDRIRSVDLTAGPGHRIFRLAVVTIGTGQSGDELKLDAVPRSRAEQLRQVLLPAATGGTAEAVADDELARMRPAWFGYSMLTTSLVLVVWGALASAIGSFSELLGTLGAYDALAGTARSLGLWLVLAAGFLLALVIGAAGALALSVEMWWGFRLTRGADALRVRRGLLTTRSVSLQEARLRGVEIAEPLVLRAARGARLNAVATGLSEGGENQPDNKVLLPPAPRATVREVAGLVLGAPFSPALRGHPRAALHRRLVRAGAAWAVLAVTAVVLVLRGIMPGWAAVLIAVAALVLLVALAVAGYRALGHQLDERQLVARSGAVVRRTVALRREGIIGWRMRQTVFQRRSGLISVAATTAAGSGMYAVSDVSTSEGLRLAEEAVPDLLTPFLEPVADSHLE